MLDMLVRFQFFRAHITVIVPEMEAFDWLALQSLFSKMKPMENITLMIKKHDAASFRFHFVYY